MNYVDVTTFGADPSGASDSTAAIQSALTYASSLGGIGVLYFPMGTYQWNGTVTGAAGVKFWAEPGVRVKTYSSMTYIYSYVQAQTQTPAVADIAFYNFEFEGMVAGVYFAELAWCDNIEFHNVTWSGIARVLDANGTNYGRIVHCENRGTPAQPAGTMEFYAYPSPDTGVTYYTGNWDLDRYFCRNLGNGFTGPLLTVQRGVTFTIRAMLCNDASAGGTVNGIEIRGDSQGVIVVDSTIAAAGIGIVLSSDTRNAASSRLPTFCSSRGNNLDGCKTFFILDQGFYNSHSENMITDYGVASYGILLQPPTGGTQNAKVQDCIFDGFTGAGAAAVIFAGDAEHCTVTGNGISDSGIGVAVLGGASQHVLIANNNFRADVGTAVIFAPGSTYPYPTNVVRQNAGTPDVV